jgi:hypothetical protein
MSKAVNEKVEIKTTNDCKNQKELDDFLDKLPPGKCCKCLSSCDINNWWCNECVNIIKNKCFIAPEVKYSKN